MKTIFAILEFNIKTLLRNFKSNAIMFILPIAFMGIFALVFGGDSQTIEFQVGIVQSDQAVSIDKYIEEKTKGELANESLNEPIKDINLEKLFNEISSENEELMISTNVYSSVDELEKALKNGSIDIGIAAFPQINTNEVQGNSEPNMNFQLSDFLKFNIYGFTNEPSFVIYESIIDQILNRFAGVQELTTTQPITLDSGNENINQSGYDALVPGLMIYGLLILIPGIAQSFSEVVEKGYIKRFRYSRVSAFEIILGSTLFYMILGIIQLVILYATAVLLGYNSNGSVLIAFIPAFFCLFFVIGLGLLIGGLVNKTEPATNLGTIVSIILGFLSGAFIAGIGGVLTFNLFGYTLSVTDILPSKWATEAVEAVLKFDSSLSDIRSELIFILVSGLLIFALGIFVYDRFKLKGSEE